MVLRINGVESKAKRDHDPSSEEAVVEWRCYHNTTDLPYLYGAAKLGHGSRTFQMMMARLPRGRLETHLFGGMIGV
jgi:hypothetical protein